MTRARTNADQAHTESVESIPHIIPGVLYPAVAGKLLDGSTSHSGNYGTAQADGFSYYYTDIKGSKPIKDPRIGAHFGSQRHIPRSIQLLEQETATHGSNIYSVDGREWFRARSLGNMAVQNTADGTYVKTSYGSSALASAEQEFFEIVGYFNAVNIRILTDTDSNELGVKIDGGTAVTSGNALNTTVSSPIRSRYVDSGSLVSLAIGSVTLGLHTIKIYNQTTNDNFECHGIELIAQDTTSTATKSQIQIPSQNVVSYGKKFTVSGTPHYNPFAFKTDGTTAWTSGNHNGTAWPVGTGSSANIDTATSLGLDAWVSTNYYYPYNGGRVVWWIDSSGTLKCSVNMMPPNAKSWNDADISKKANASVANDTYLPTFEAYTTSIGEDLLDEVAKTYNFREFGNGAANGGTGATYADFSMVSATSDALAYVMDDGLTSLSTATGYCDISGWHFTDLSLYDTNGTGYLTFIGTGISTNDQTANGTWVFGTIAQNLPYGTHIVKLVRDGSTNGDHVVDGVACATNYLPLSYGAFSDVTIHQPKKPPIPEDAVVLADYMLMADFVPQTSVGEEYISKGTRSISCSRDFMHTGSNNMFMVQQVDGGMGFAAGDIAESGGTWKLSTFSTNFVLRGYQTDTRHNLYLDGVDKDSAATKDNTAAYGSFSYITTSYELGTHTVEHRRVSTNANWSLYDIATPIHTSSHYQSFESPFLHELVGGDRNMEQNNLVVTPDGKTWDEVTRDTSYIGDCVLTTSTDTSYTSNADTQIFDEWRGAHNTYRNYFNKYFAIAYDRMICLEAGQYMITAQTIRNGSANTSVEIRINGLVLVSGYTSDGNHDTPSSTASVQLKRGDYVQLKGLWHTGEDQGLFQIYKN